MNRFLGVLRLFADSTAVDEAKNVINQSYGAFIRIVNIVLPVLIAVLLVVGMFYGIQLGVKYARAEDEEKRKAARQSLINVAVGIIIAIIFVVIVEVVLNQNFVADLFGGRFTNESIYSAKSA